MIRSSLAPALVLLVASSALADDPFGILSVAQEGSYDVLVSSRDDQTQFNPQHGFLSFDIAGYSDGPANLTQSHDFGNGTAYGSTAWNYLSSFAPFAISAGDSIACGTSTTGGPDGPYANAFGTSSIEIDLAPPSALLVRVAYHLRVASPDVSIASISLMQGDSPLFKVSTATDGSTTGSAIVTFPAAPLVVYATGQASAGLGTSNDDTQLAEWSFELTLCHADFNGDGFLDFFDFNDYVTCFEGGSCGNQADADFNGDGFVDFFDFNDFVTAFEEGC